MSRGDMKIFWVLFIRLPCPLFRDVLHRYYNQKDVKQKWKKDRLVRLGKKLMEEKQMEDFHRIVLEKEFREELLNEMI